LPLLEFCSRNAATVRITYTYVGICEELLVASAYLPYNSDEPPPPKKIRDFTHSLALAVEILFLRITWLRRDQDGDQTQVQKK
jgi:hypothetical protein